VTIADTDFHSVVPDGRRFAPLAAAAHSPIVIERNVFLGAGSGGTIDVSAASPLDFDYVQPVQSYQ
jgi:hypothetical protein